MPGAGLSYFSSDSFFSSLRLATSHCDSGACAHHAPRCLISVVEWVHQNMVPVARLPGCRSPIRHGGLTQQINTSNFVGFVLRWALLMERFHDAPNPKGDLNFRKLHGLSDTQCFDSHQGPGSTWMVISFSCSSFS